MQSDNPNASMADVPDRTMTRWTDKNPRTTVIHCESVKPRVQSSSGAGRPQNPFKVVWDAVKAAAGGLLAAPGCQSAPVAQDEDNDDKIDSN